MDSTHPFTNNAIAAPSAGHPLVLAAAASVTILSLAGVAYFAGWLPGPAVHAVVPPTPIATATQAAGVTVPPPPSVVYVPREQVRQMQTAQPSRQIRTPRATASAPSATPAHENNTPLVEPRIPMPVATTLPPICRECGVIESVQVVPVEAKGSGGGAVAGGIVGGIIGNQIGRGVTRDIATVLGAVGGAYAGNHIEKSTKESKRYDVNVRFEDGSTRTFSGDTPPVWRIGDRVRLQNGTLTSSAGRSASDLGTI